MQEGRYTLDFIYIQEFTGGIGYAVSEDKEIIRIKIRKEEIEQLLHLFDVIVNLNIFKITY